MSKMNWDRVRSESRSALADSQTRNYMNSKKSAQRKAKRKLYGWWTKMGDKWYVALDADYKIGPERIAQVKKSSGQVVDYIVGDSPEKVIDYEGGSYSLYKVRKV